MEVKAKVYGGFFCYIKAKTAKKHLLLNTPFIWGILPDTKIGRGKRWVLRTSCSSSVD